jgi:hypothetical protein
MMRMAAQNPKTISTSPSRCHKPACLGDFLASASKYEVQKVCSTAMAKMMLAPNSVGVKFIETYYQGVSRENPLENDQIKMLAI